MGQGAWVGESEAEGDDAAEAVTQEGEAVQPQPSGDARYVTHEVVDVIGVRAVGPGGAAAAPVVVADEAQVVGQGPKVRRDDGMVEARPAVVDEEGKALSLLHAMEVDVDEQKGAGGSHGRYWRGHSTCRRLNPNRRGLPASSSRSSGLESGCFKESRSCMVGSIRDKELLCPAEGSSGAPFT
jgi:hypothetical protein